MKSRGYPLWLLRDWTALVAFLIAFWSFIFAGFRAGRRVARGKRLSELELQTLFQLYANAESRLDHAIWRQAWRACGYSAKHATFVQMPAPTNTEELEARFLSYNRALCEIEQLVVAYTDDLRRRFNITKAEVGDPNALITSHACTRTVARQRPCFAPATLRRVCTAKPESALAFCARGPPALPFPQTPIRLAGAVSEVAPACSAAHQIPETPKSRH